MYIKDDDICTYPISILLTKHCFNKEDGSVSKSCKQWLGITIAHSDERRSARLSKENAIKLRNDLDEFIKKCD